MYHMWYTTRIHKNQMKPKRIYKPATNRSGTSFHSFLEKQGIRAEVEAVAIKRVLAWQFQQAMRRQQKTKQAMATQLRTSRSQLDRLLDPENVSVSLATIARAAQVLGKRLIIRVTTPKSKLLNSPFIPVLGAVIIWEHSLQLSTIGFSKRPH